MMRRPVVLVLALSAWLLALVDGSPPDAVYDWVITKEFHNPDGYWRQVFHVNGEFPGPTVRVTNGGRVVVNVTNLSMDDITIHWHGVEQLPSGLWYDGVSMGTQCPLGPGSSMVYNFTVSQAPGIMMWHGHHYANEADGLTGPFIVDPNPEDPTEFDTLALEMAQDYEAEVVLSLTDWFHDSGVKTAQKVAPIPGNKYAAADAGFPYMYFEEPKSVLINGKGDYQCVPEREGVQDLHHSACWPMTEDFVGNSSLMVVSGGSTTINVTAGRRYLLRMANMGIVYTLRVSVAGHKLILVGADGSPIQPIILDSLKVDLGESYDAILEATGEPGQSYVLSVELPAKNFAQKAELVYSDWPAEATDMAPFSSSLLSQELPDYSGLVFHLTWIKSAMEFPEDMRSLEPDQTIYFENYQMYDRQRRLTWPVNGHEFRWDPSGLPLLPLAKYDLLAEGLHQPEHNIYQLRQGDVVDLVLVNHGETWAGELGMVDKHPWHLHGMHFWVLGYGPGRFNRTDPEHQALLNLEDPSRRNMAPLLFPYYLGEDIPNLDTIVGGANLTAHCYVDDPRPDCQLLQQPFGWTVLRVKAESPGVWAFHCHMLWHYLQNMRAYFIIAPDEVPDMPLGLPQTCGSSDVWEEVNQRAGNSYSRR